MIERGKILNYNAELKEGLSELWNATNKGQQKKFLREHPKIKALLVRFGILPVEAESPIIVGDVPTQPEKVPIVSGVVE